MPYERAQHVKYIMWFLKTSLKCCIIWICMGTSVYTYTVMQSVTLVMHIYRYYIKHFSHILTKKCVFFFVFLVFFFLFFALLHILVLCFFCQYNKQTGLEASLPQVPFSSILPSGNSSHDCRQLQVTWAADQFNQFTQTGFINCLSEAICNILANWTDLKIHLQNSHDPYKTQPDKWWCFPAT